MTRPPSSETRPRWLDWLLLAALMLGHFAVVVDVARRKSPTVDEVAHLPAGLSYLEKHTFKIYRLSPPLGRLVPALAARSVAPALYYGKQWNLDPANHWQFAFMWLLTCTDEPAKSHAWLTAFTHARIAVAVWSALTIPLLFIWGFRWFGRGGGWIASLLWAMSPNIIAHASMVTTDIAAASTTLLACFAFSLWLERPSFARMFGAGIALAAAQLVKFSALWLFGFFPLWWLKKGDKYNFRNLVAIYLTCLFFMNAGYLFEGTGASMGKFPFVSEMLTRPRVATDGPPDEGANRTFNDMYLRRVNRFRGSLFDWFPCPLPYHYVAGFDEQKFEADGKYQMYLNGDLRHGGEPGKRVGWWYFYLFALAVKEPIGTWLLVAVGSVLAFARCPEWKTKTIPLVLLTLIPLATISFLTDICIGVRYVLPIYPFAFLLAGAIALAKSKWLRIGLPLVVLAWNAWAIFSIHPHELAYFNETVGGPTCGRLHLIDSNLDWGQDLRSLSRWLDRHPDWKHDVRIAYMGTTPPEFEGVGDYRLAPRDPRFVPEERRLPAEKADPLHNMGPQPGKFAVSVNFEGGMQFHQPLPIAMMREVMSAGGQAMLPGTQMFLNPRHAYSYFQRFEPRFDREIGYSILLFEITPEQANAARRAMGLPAL